MLASAFTDPPEDFLQLEECHVDPSKRKSSQSSWNGSDMPGVTNTCHIQRRDRNSESEVSLMMRGIDGGETAQNVAFNTNDSSAGIIPKIKRVKKLWLHDAVIAHRPVGSEASDLTSSQNTVTCRYCGAHLTSSNISVRKKHLLNPKVCRYLRSQDALENADRDVRSAVEALSEGHNYLKRKTFLGSPIMSACSIKEKDAKDEKKERESLDFMAAAASQNLQLMQTSFAQVTQENIRVQVKLLYLQEGIAASDEYIHHLMGSKVMLSRQARHIHSMQLMYQASIDNIPPPANWSPEWREHMKNLDMSMHLAYLRSFFHEAQLLEKESNRGSPVARIKLKELVDKRSAISRFQLQGNVSLVLAARGCDVVTGQRIDPGEAWWRNRVSQLMPFITDEVWPMLKAVWAIYSERMSMIMDKRKNLLHRLEALNGRSRSYQNTVQPAAPNWTMLQQPFYPQRQPQGSSGIQQSMSVPEMLLTGEKELDAILHASQSEFYCSLHHPVSEDSVEDSMILMDAVLADIERSYMMEGKERAVLIKICCKIYGHSLSLKTLLAAYPYVLDVPSSLHFLLEEHSRLSSAGVSLKANKMGRLLSSDITALGAGGC